MKILSIFDSIRLAARCGASVLGLVALISPAPAKAHATVPPASIEAHAGAAPAADFLLTLVERELAAAAADGAVLEAIYRRQVRSLEEAATFFFSAPFLRLDLAGQRQVIDHVLALDPAGFLARVDFLPVGLREEYRRKAAEAAELQALGRLSRLTVEEQLRLYLPSRAGMSGSAGGQDAFGSEGQMRRFLQDAALELLPAIDDAWVAAAGGPFLSAEALVEAKVLTARNLAGRGLQPSRENVAASWRDLAAARDELAGLALFAGREVVFAAGKKVSSADPTFGKPTTVASLKSQAPATFELLRSGEPGAVGRLARAIAAAGELTLILETHGRPDALQFGGALEADELAGMFAARRSASRAIVIVNACFGHDFARAFAARLAARGIPAPILIVPEEFGQATLVGRQESGFTRDELGLGRPGSSHLGDLWPGRHRETAVYAQLGPGLAQLR